MTINVALCTDEKFVVPALVCITSLFENNKDNKCKVYVLTEGISDIAVFKFMQLAGVYGQEISVVRPNTNKLKDLVTRGRYRKSMYFRFLLPEILNEESIVLYLDCDIMIRKKLDNLFQTDISDVACGVVEDQQSDDVQIQNRLKLSTTYFNSGVMLMNLEYWRKHNLSDSIIHFIDSKPELCVYPDQDALNVVLSSKVCYLDYEYNYQEMWLTMREYSRFHFQKWNKINIAGKSPTIVHFCVDNKPWYEECENPFKSEYLKYATMYGFVNFKLKKKYSWIYYRIEAEIMRLKRWQKRFVN